MEASTGTVRDEKEIARQYLLDHKISKLFKRILVLLLLNKPSNVKRFIVEHLKKEKHLESKALLNNDEMETMFTMLEEPVMGKGFVTGKKINSSLVAMGIDESVKDEQTFTLQQFKSTLASMLKQY